MIKAIAAYFGLIEAQLLAKTKLVNAIARDERLKALSKVGDVDELLEIAINAGMLGLRAEDLGPMVRNWYLSSYRLKSIQRLAQQYAKELRSTDE
jgi:hypothetical protein